MLNYQMFYTPPSCHLRSWISAFSTGAVVSAGACAGGGGFSAAALAKARSMRRRSFSCASSSPGGFRECKNT